MVKNMIFCLKVFILLSSTYFSLKFHLLFMWCIWYFGLHLRISTNCVTVILVPCIMVMTEHPRTDCTPFIYLSSLLFSVKQWMWMVNFNHKIMVIARHEKYFYSLQLKMGFQTKIQGTLHLFRNSPLMVMKRSFPPSKCRTKISYSLSKPEFSWEAVRLSTNTSRATSHLSPERGVVVLVSSSLLGKIKAEKSFHCES